MIIALMLVVGVLVVGGVVALGLRSWLSEEGQVADEIRSHESTDLVYLVPAGEDPAVLIAALHHAGYPSTTDSRDGHSRLLVDCPGGREHDRDEVRGVIEHAHLAGPDGVAFSGAGSVRFEDEG
ncbi:MAG TPA: hypothetical protein VFK52_03705 [Nocardioidaceae bacterium]|nr:hypothetical protein [Nocardioidaceae bacterium]